MKKINHKGLWFDSMTGMTLGFIATLIVGTIIGIFGLYSNNNIFITVKKVMTFITPFGIGIGIGIKHKLKPLEILSVGIVAFIVGRSLISPKWENNTINFENIDVNINLSFYTPGDVFASWLAGVGMLYFFKFYKKETALDIFIIPLISVFLGIFGALWLTYITSFFTVSFEWIIHNTINEKLWLGLLLAPIFGMIMGLALSLPTSSAAMAVALGLNGDSAVVAIAATSSQMIAFGVMTYVHTKSISKSLAVGFGTSMLQISNFTKKPKLLIIPVLTSMIVGTISLATFDGLLPFSDVNSATSGMGTSALYGQIFTLKENGWLNEYAWLNIIFIQIALPALLSFIMSIFTNKKGIIVRKDLLF
ncbi:MAG: PTS sugar transporter subunit IIC [Mycoplasmatales bacterium]|nr:PTS sugar transporter subunit IIC [Mycoplasmatales bacterium]